jgi:hypothetical protein
MISAAEAKKKDDKIDELTVILHGYMASNEVIRKDN